LKCIRKQEKKQHSKDTKHKEDKLQTNDDTGPMFTGGKMAVGRLAWGSSRSDVPLLSKWRFAAMFSASDCKKTKPVHNKEQKGLFH